MKKIILIASLLLCSPSFAKSSFIKRCIEDDSDVRSAIYFNWGGPLPPEFPDDCENGYYLLLQKEELELSYCDSIDFISEFTQVKSLKINKSKLYGLRPLQSLINLRRLSLDGGNYKSLKSLKYLTQLQQLSIQHNPNIQALDELGGLASIQMLNVDHNTIKNIEGVSSLQQLLTFSARSNQISDIRVLKQLSALQQADLSENGLTEFDCRSQLKGHALEDKICTHL